MIALSSAFQLSPDRNLTISNDIHRRPNLTTTFLRHPNSSNACPLNFTDCLIPQILIFYCLDRRMGSAASISKTVPVNTRNLPSAFSSDKRPHPHEFHRLCSSTSSCSSPSHASHRGCTGAPYQP